MAINKLDVDGVFCIEMDLEDAIDHDLARVDHLNRDVILCDDIVDILENFRMDCTVNYDPVDETVVLVFNRDIDRDLMLDDIYLLIGWM